MRRVALLLAGIVLVLDLASKWWVVHTPRLHYFPILDGFFTIEYTLNRGIAFGLLHQVESPWKPALLTLVALLALGLVAYYLLTTPPNERLLLVALGILLGGILGNLIDRLADETVVDFLKLHWGSRFAWPTFNIADAAISTGVFLVLFDAVRPRGKTVVAAFLVFGFAAARPAEAAEPPELLVRLQTRYAEIQSLRARFEQVVRDRIFEQREKGRLLLKKPALMYWEYEEPTRKLFVADGQKSYFYVPRDRQVLVTRVDLSSLSSPLLLLLGETRFRNDFQITEARPPGGEDWACLHFRPLHADPDFEEVVACACPEDLLVRYLRVVDPIGQVQEYYLTEIEENVSIPDSQFVFRIPPGVEVVEE
ncbi:MAG: hypothetical protein Kow00109_03310 [Acidobacteriota bacterium]